LTRETTKLHLKNCGYVSAAKQGDPGPVYNFGCSRHVMVVSGPGKVVKIGPKHFSVVLMRNEKKCNPNIGGMFRVQNRVIRTRFSTLPAPGLFRWCPNLEKLSKLDRNIFQLYWWKTIRTVPKKCGYDSGIKRSHLGSIFNFAYSWPVQLVFGPGNVIKIW